MKRFIFESKEGDEVFWPKGKINPVTDDSGGSGKAVGPEIPGTPGTPAPADPNAKPGKPSKSDKPGADTMPPEGKPGVPEIEIKDFNDLDEETKEAIRNALSNKQNEFDAHIDRDTSEGVQNTSENMENIKKRLNEVRKKARQEEAYKNNGRNLSDQYGRVDTVLILHKAVVNWKEKLRAFFRPWTSRRMQKTYTQSNRRDMTLNRAGPTSVVRPGAKPEAPDPNKLHIFVTVDTSGSVDDNMLASFISEIKGIFTQSVCIGSNIEVRIINWTGAITGDTLLKDTNFMQYFNKAKRTASGATNFGAIKEYLVAKKYRPVAIVHFTDGDVTITEDMMFRDNGKCKNLIVLPNGMKSSIEMCKKHFDVVIPMVIYDTETN